VSPIFVRPVREQLEHDRLIRHLQAKYKKKHEVAINPGEEQQAPVRVGTSTFYPDLVLSEGKKLVAIVEVETGESVNNLEAMYQWVPFSRAKVPFHLYVPVPGYEAARRLTDANQARITEIWTYRPANEGFDLVRLHTDPAAVAATKGGKAAVMLPPPPKPVPPPPVVEPPKPPVAPAATTVGKPGAGPVKGAKVDKNALAKAALGASAKTGAKPVAPAPAARPAAKGGAAQKPGASVKAAVVPAKPAAPSKPAAQVKAAPRPGTKAGKPAPKSVKPPAKPAAKVARLAAKPAAKPVKKPAPKARLSPARAKPKKGAGAKKSR
jgi:hypothetical protein